MTFSVQIPTNHSTTENKLTCQLSIHPTSLDVTSPKPSVPSQTVNRTREHEGACRIASLVVGSSRMWRQCDLRASITRVSFCEHR